MIINKSGLISIVFSILITFAVNQVYAEGFNVAGIPEELKTNADAVIRIHETIFTIQGPSSATSEKHWAITIFNERGEEMHNRVAAYYDKLSKVKKIEARIYDADGRLMRTIKTSDAQDIGLNAFGDDVGDARMKVINIGRTTYSYPYTVEFRYILESSNMMFYSIWNPYEEERTSLENASFTVITPENFPFRKKEIVIDKPQESMCEPHKKCFTWKLRNLPAYEEEANSPPDARPCVMTAPVELEVEGYKGSIKEWSDISKFYYALNKDRDLLPQELKAKALELVKGEKDTKEKIRKLYEYLQSNTRYMSIQLGLGGWQTIEAKEVVSKGYGDCKALSNYMKALLNAANIPAYQALVAAGPSAETVYQDFPCMRFNHVITCVPLAKDTIWLECTSQTAAMGYQGSFTGNRKALLIKPEGGQLVNTTVYTPADNKQIRKASVKILENGTAEASVITTYTGLQQDRRHALMTGRNTEEQQKWLTDHIHISSFELKSFAFSERKTQIPEVTEKLVLIVRKMATQSGTRFFLVPNLMTGFIDVPLMDKERKMDLFLTPNAYNFQDIDTISYELPAGFAVEYLPDPVKVSSKFGEYSKQAFMKDGRLLYYRSAILKAGTYPKTDFKEWTDFIKKVIRSDKEQVVFTSKT